MKPTLSDIARQADVSVSTVSQALRGKGTVAKETREKILHVARELGYNRKAYKEDLKIGVVAGTTSLSDSDIYKQYFTGIKNELGASVHLVATVDDSNLFPINTITDGSDQLDGIIFFGGEDDHPSIKPIIDGTETKVVLINRYPNDERVSTVCINNYEVFYDVTKHLVEHGHQHFAFACTEPANSWSLMRFRGHKAAVEQLTENGQTHLLKCPRNQRRVLGEMLFELDPLPKALVAESDGLACLLLDYIQKQGLRVPEDMVIVGCDDLPCGKTVSPKLSTINTSARRIGETAARLIREVIQNDFCSAHITIPARPVYRESCGCRCRED